MDFLSRAMEMIEVKAGKVIQKSAVYETEPWGFEDQTSFLNQVVEIETNLHPAELLDQLLTIEVQLGRIRPFDGCGCGIPASSGRGEGADQKAAGYAGRTIDLDILFFGSQLIFTDQLMIPHPRLHERKFALVPLNETAPAFVHPLLKKSMAVLLQECRDQAKVEKV